MYIGISMTMTSAVGLHARAWAWGPSEAAMQSPISGPASDRGMTFPNRTPTLRITELRREVAICRNKSTHSSAMRSTLSLIALLSVFGCSSAFQLQAIRTPAHVRAGSRPLRMQEEPPPAEEAEEPAAAPSAFNPNPPMPSFEKLASGKLNAPPPQEAKDPKVYIAYAAGMAILVAIGIFFPEQ